MTEIKFQDSPLQNEYTLSREAPYVESFSETFLGFFFETFYNTYCYDCSILCYETDKKILDACLERLTFFRKIYTDARHSHSSIDSCSELVTGLTIYELEVMFEEFQDKEWMSILVKKV
jgi:hypothetical protein